MFVNTSCIHRAKSGVIPRMGMSMVEVVISMAIFVTLLAAVTASTVSSRDYEALGAAQDEVYLDSSNVMQQIAQDMGVSGWYVPDGTPTTDPSGVPLAPLPYNALETSGKMTTAMLDDRNRRYYPYVLQQASANGVNTGGRGLQFPHLQRDESLVVIPELPPNLTGDPVDFSTNFSEVSGTMVGYVDDDIIRRRYRESFHARSQELVFVKATIGEWVPRPDRVAAISPAVNLSGTPAAWRTQDNHSSLGVLHASPWEAVGGDPTNVVLRSGVTSDYKYGVIMDSGYLTVVNGQPAIAPQWERLASADPTFQPPRDVSRVREHTYAVVPSPRGLGRLVRAYCLENPPSGVTGVEVGQYIGYAALPTPRAMVVDRILSDDVVRITFDTYRNDTSLGNPAAFANNLACNQIRVRLFLARRSLARSELIISRIAEATLTMRAKLGASWMQQDQERLGTVRAGLPH